MVALDSLSDIPPLAVDEMCRTSTGDGDVRRKLYTDGDFAVFAFKRCILFAGIDVGALAPDLAERAVPIVLDLISDEKRKPEKAFWRDWPSAHPKLLGALLDLAVTVLANPAPAETSARRTHAKLLRRSISPPSQPEKSGGDSAPSAFGGAGKPLRRVRAPSGRPWWHAVPGVQARPRRPE
jgi:hypothetical protein